MGTPKRLDILGGNEFRLRQGFGYAKTLGAQDSLRPIFDGSQREESFEIGCKHLVIKCLDLISKEVRKTHLEN